MQKIVVRMTKSLRQTLNALLAEPFSFIVPTERDKPSTVAFIQDLDLYVCAIEDCVKATLERLVFYVFYVFCIK